MSAHQSLPSTRAELLDEPTPLDLQALALACSREPGWVVERVEAGVLQGDRIAGHWRFASSTVVRARRIAQLETSFGADPQLAALTTDLIEEVQRLRQRLRQLQG